MSESIYSDLDFFDDSDIRTHTKVEQVRKQWSVIFESLAKGEKSLAFVYPPDGIYHNIWVVEKVHNLTFDVIKDHVDDRFCALVRLTTYLDIKKEDLND